jgi:quinoprotein glucose dehydrogenase
MDSHLIRFLALALTLAASDLLATGCSKSQMDLNDLEPAPDTGWDYYGNDAGGTRYSQLSQINRDNIGHLAVAWRFRTGDLGDGFAAQNKMAYEATPVLYHGRLYLNTPFGKVFALDAKTGQQIWSFDAVIDPDQRYAEAASRGVTVWEDPAPRPDQRCQATVFQGTLDGRLIALDATTGLRCVAFADNGEIDLSKGVRLKDANDYTITSPAAILGDLVIVGSAIGDNRMIGVERGIVRAFDARTGALRWSWDPLPVDPADEFWDEWGEEAATSTGAANAWSVISVDEQRDLVFVPTSSASTDFYGGLRPGNNNYANSLVALKGSTGEVVWHQQLVHHDLWDYDVPAQPVLIEFDRDGETIPAVVQATKMGMLFVFHRATGEPLFEIEERPVPQTAVEGETPSPTQPFPVAPPPLVPHTPVTPDDAWGLTPWDKRNCRKQIEQHRSEGIYTPPSLEGTIMYPGYAGGSNWGSVSFDPVRQYVIANTMNLPMLVRLIPRDRADAMIESGEIPERGYSKQGGTPYVMQRYALLSSWGIPCTPPPWGELAAVDLRTGTIAWQVPLGTIEDDAPAIVPNFRFGAPNIGGSIVTAGGLVFIGATTDDYLRAFDIETGEELWKGRLPAGGQATPMTYALEGRQYVVIVAGGHGGLGTTPGDYVVAFSLPN